MMHAFPNYQNGAEDFLGILIHLLRAKGSSADGTIISEKNAENGETLMLLNLKFRALNFEY